MFSLGFYTEAKNPLFIVAAFVGILMVWGVSVGKPLSPEVSEVDECHWCVCVCVCVCVCSALLADICAPLCFALRVNTDCINARLVVGGHAGNWTDNSAELRRSATLALAAFSFFISLVSDGERKRNLPLISAQVYEKQSHEERLIKHGRSQRRRRADEDAPKLQWLCLDNVAFLNPSSFVLLFLCLLSFTGS